VPFIAGIRARAASLARTVVFAEGDDERVASAAERFCELGLGRALVIASNPQSGNKRAGVEWIAGTPEDRVQIAHRMVAAGDADAAVAGAVHTTADVIRSALRNIGTAPGIRLVSSAFYMVFAGRDDLPNEVITFTDCAVVPYPSAEDLCEIALAAAAWAAVLSLAQRRLSTTVRHVRRDVAVVEGELGLADEIVERNGLEVLHANGIVVVCHDGVVLHKADAPTVEHHNPHTGCAGAR